MQSASSKFVLLIRIACATLIYIRTASADVAHGTGYREHEERSRFRFTDDGEPDTTTKVDRVTCGGVNDLAYEESVKFKLNKKKPCNLVMFGSMAEKCTAAITCSTLNFPDPVDGKCTEGFIRITDSLGGALTMCGTVKFHGPYIPSNNGSDLHIYYHNPAKKTTVCMVVCNEDRERKRKIPGRPLINEFTRRKNKGCMCGANLQQSKISPAGRGRIVGGTHAAPFEFPWLAAIVDKGTRKNFCGGSLINDRFILTAAHCFAGFAPVEAGDIEILLHSHVLDFNPNEDYDPKAPAGQKGSVKEVPGLNLPVRTDSDENTIRVEAASIIVHPLYRRRSTDFDVALVKLQTPVDLTHPNVSTVCLAKEGHVRSYVGQTSVVAGWGKPHETAGAASRLLQKLSVPIINYKECGDLLDVQVSPRMVCAGHLEAGRDSCVGDSGGPLIYQFNDKQYRQIGVVSYGHGCARENSPGVYVNVQEVLQWIYHETSDAEWCLKEEKDTM